MQPDTLSAGLTVLTGLTPETLSTIMAVIIGPIIWLLVEQIKKRLFPDLGPKQTTSIVALFGALGGWGICALTNSALDVNNLVLLGLAVAGSSTLTNGATK